LIRRVRDTLALKMVAIPTPFARSLQGLPAEIIRGLCTYLTGFDALNLSHTSSSWLKCLSSEVDWHKRLGRSNKWKPERPGRSWKKVYVRSRSMVFKALKVEKDASEELDAFAYLTSEQEQHRLCVYRTTFFQLTRRYTGDSFSFSFDTWFSLLPGTRDEYFAGIIFGHQSSFRDTRQWPHYHQQFVVVSSAGELYCSVQNGKHIVASNLGPNRWYHLALTFDHDIQREEVFLDGKNVRSEVGSLHEEWSHLIYGQVGTGCVTSNSLQCPRRGYIGWYGFHGVVDTFRVWKGVISSAELGLLARGGELPDARLRASTIRHPLFSRLNFGLRQRNVRLVKCTRPAEGKSVQLLQ
jgi:hypothetical protein